MRLASVGMLTAIADRSFGYAQDDGQRGRRESVGALGGAKFFLSENIYAEGYHRS